MSLAINKGEIIQVRYTIRKKTVPNISNHFKFKLLIITLITINMSIAIDEKRIIFGFIAIFNATDHLHKINQKINNIEIIAIIRKTIRYIGLLVKIIINRIKVFFVKYN